jgi:hypothetical protein
MYILEKSNTSPLCILCTIIPQTNTPNYTHPSLHVVHSKLCSITPVATKVQVMLWSFIVLTQMHESIESVYHVTLWNNTKCNILMVWCGPLHLTFPNDVAYACTNIQQVA